MSWPNSEVLLCTSILYHHVDILNSPFSGKQHFGTNVHQSYNP